MEQETGGSLPVYCAYSIQARGYARSTRIGMWDLILYMYVCLYTHTISVMKKATDNFDFKMYDDNIWS